MVSKISTALIIFLLPAWLWAQTPCDMGYAGSYPCDQVTLLGHLTPTDLHAGMDNYGGHLNDIWGWVDPQNDNEYALVGMVNGTAFVNVTDPTNPIYIGMLPTAAGSDKANSPWRDIKVYDHYAYIIADNMGNHGMQIFDLHHLRTSATDTTFAEDGHYSGFGSAHNLVIDEPNKKLYIVGISSGTSTCGAGGLHILDLSSTPLDPAFIGCYDADGYTHDAECLTYTGPDTDYQGDQICFSANENTLTFVDTTDPNNPMQIARVSYPSVNYAHQCWVTPDQKFLISNDELDELNTGMDTRTLIWNISNLDNPVLIGQHFRQNKSIDHNLYIQDSLIYESNYESGLVILETSRVAEGQIREVGYFDTYPASDNTQFNGTWSNYPYLPSGNIIVSDINNGLFILKPDFSVKLVQTSPQDIDQVTSGDSISFSVKAAGSNLQYQWQVDKGQGPVDITTDGGGIYSGWDSDSLVINGVTSFLKDNQYRCLVTDTHKVRDFSFYAGILSFDGQATTTGLADEWKGNVSIFPNPSVGTVYIQNSDPQHLVDEVNVYQLDGAKIKTINPSANQQSIALHLSKGMFLIQCKSREGLQFIKRILVK